MTMQVREGEQLQRILRSLDQRLRSLEATQASRRTSPSPPARPAVEDYLDQLFEREQRYANTIIVLGYGGFFALWVATHARMPIFWFAMCGGLMSISLLFFIGWELRKTLGMSVAMRRVAGKSDLVVLQAVRDAGRRINHHWSWVFGISAVAGLAAGGILIAWFIGSMLPTP